MTSGRLFEKRAGASTTPCRGIRSGTGCRFTGSPAIQKTPRPTTATIITLPGTVMQLRFIFHEITGSVPGILQRFHITTLDPEHGGFTRLLSEAFPGIRTSTRQRRVIGRRASIRRCWFTEGVHRKNGQSIALPGSRCRALHHALWIIVASEDDSLKSPISTGYLC